MVAHGSTIHNNHGSYEIAISIERVLQNPDKISTSTCTCT
jgi:hypothetical protein